MTSTKAPETQWQPIETALKDGKPVDLWVKPPTNGDGCRIADAWFHNGRWYYRDGAKTVAIGWWTPTHWMRVIPPPPAGGVK